MTSCAPNFYLVAALLITSTLAGTVTLGSGASVTVADPLTSSLSSSYTLADGFTWNRVRNGGYNKFSEDYSLSIQPGCIIGCGPHSWPVTSGGRLYCERDLSRFTKNQPFTGAAYKALCIPNVSTSAGSCQFATYTIPTTSVGGKCNYASIAGNPLYMANSQGFDCCLNNLNQAENLQVDEFTDKDATI